MAREVPNFACVLVRRLTKPLTMVVAPLWVTQVAVGVGVEVVVAG